MKKFILFLWLFAGTCNVWGQMPTATPSPNLIFKTKNLNFSNALPPLNLFIYLHQYPVDATEINTALRDIAILDKSGRSAVVYGTRAPGDLFDVGDNANKDDIYFEEFKFDKKIDSNMWLVKLPVPEKDKLMYQGTNHDVVADLFAKDYSKIFCLENTSDKTNSDNIQNGEMLNAVVRVNGFYTYVDNNKSTNYVKLDVVSADEKSVWNPLPTPTPGAFDKLRESLKNYTEDTNPQNANCTFNELLKDPDKASGKKVVGKFFVKLKKYTDPNDDNNYTDEPIDESAKPSYLLIPKNSGKYFSGRYFQIFEGENDKETYENLVVGSTVTLYVMVMSGALPFDEKHTITKLYFMAKIK